jgi:hypothetical protein
MGQRTEDINLLKRFDGLEIEEDLDFPSKGKVSESEKKAFSDMLDRLLDGRYACLTASQRKWAKGVLERAKEEPQYLNEFSAGKIPRGKEVATPLVLQNLPKSPPPRKREE